MAGLVSRSVREYFCRVIKWNLGGRWPWVAMVAVTAASVLAVGSTATRASARISRPKALTLDDCVARWNTAVLGTGRRLVRGTAGFGQAA